MWLSNFQKVVPDAISYLNRDLLDLSLFISLANN